MTEALIKGFEEENGAEVQVRYGEDEGLASQIEQEGGATPADVVLTENTPPLELLAGKGLPRRSRPRPSKKCPPGTARRPGTGSESRRARR